MSWDIMVTRPHGNRRHQHARISELLQIHGVDPLTVEHQTDTSVAKIEKRYLCFIPSALLAKLAAVKDTKPLTDPKDEA